MVDMEQTVLQHIQTRTGSMFATDNYVISHEGCANSFMNGAYSLRALHVAARTKEVIRREVEKTECCQGVTITHSVGGGTGSGLGMRIVDEIRPLIVKSFGCIWLFSVFPSKVGNFNFYVSKFYAYNGFRLKNPPPLNFGSFLEPTLLNSILDQKVRFFESCLNVLGNSVAHFWIFLFILLLFFRFFC